MKKIKLIAIVAAVLFVLAACSAQDRIVGTWKSQTTVLGVVTEQEYVFNEDGTGSTPGILGIPAAMTYTIDGNSLVVKNAVLDAAEEIVGKDLSTTYTVEFGIDTLTLIDKDGEEIKLTKSK